MHWYLVHTKPRQESTALLHLEQQGYPCYLPLRRAEKIRQRQLVVLDEPLFPRYLFVQLGQGLSAQGWGPIRSTPGVSRLVSFGATPAKVPDGLVLQLQAQESEQQRAPASLFKHGQHVQVTQGAFQGLEGVLQILDGERRAMVLIEILAKSVLVPVAPAALRRVA